MDKCKTRNDMEDNELFGERHEQGENGLYGKRHAELCDLHNVSDTFFCVYHGSCIYKGVAKICSNKDYCQSKKKAK